MKKLDKNYVSDIDKFLNSLRKSIDESASQRAERLEHECLNKLRDVTTNDSAHILTSE